MLLPLAQNAYLNDWLLFSSVEPLPLVVEGFNAELFINAKGFFTPSTRKADTQIALTVTAHSLLQIFLRLRLINNSSFLLFSLLIIKLKFVLFFCVQLLLQGALFDKFYLIKLVLSFRFSKCR